MRDYHGVKVARIGAAASAEYSTGEKDVSTLRMANLLATRSMLHL